MSNLIYRQGNYGSICFPYKESCEFATKKCLKECSEQFTDMTWFSEIFKEFKDRSVVELYASIKDSMEKNGFKLLTWFDCGDCPSQLTTKISQIILQLKDDGFTQLGFTRNSRLWKLMQSIRKIRFFLTVERGTKIKAEGYYAIPEYAKQRVCIIHHHTFDRPEQESIDEIIAKGEAFVRYCGGGSSYIQYITVTEPEFLTQCIADRQNSPIVGKMYEANCQYCLENNRGCFKKDKR